MTDDTTTILKAVAHDDFETVHPDDLIVHISRSPILKTLGISLGLHVVVIVLLSIGNFVMCAKYKTVSVTGAYAEHAAALQEQKVAEQKAERAKAQTEQKARRDAQAKEDVAAKPEQAAAAASDSRKSAPEPSAIEKELSDTSSERPTESSLSLDDIDDEF